MRTKIKCYFCGEDDPEILETHHIVPRSLGIPGTECLTIIVCPVCHRKLHKIYNILFKHIGAKIAIPPSPEHGLGVVYHKKEEILNIIKRLQTRNGMVSIEVIKKEAFLRGISGEETETMLKELFRDGLVYRPIKTTMLW